MLKIDVGDQECKKRAAQGRLEMVLEEKRAALKELDTALAIEADLAHQAQELKSPEDYKKALLKQRQSMDSLRQEVAAETNVGRQLSSRLATLTDAQSRFSRLKEDIESLKKMKQGLFTELAQLERAEAQNKSRTSGSVPELQHQLQEAQRRYAYLCTYQQALQ
jgi:chromosome segregation ATPase